VEHQQFTGLRRAGPQFSRAPQLSARRTSYSVYLVIFPLSRRLSHLAIYREARGAGWDVASSIGGITPLKRDSLVGIGEIGVNKAIDTERYRALGWIKSDDSMVRFLDQALAKLPELYGARACGRFVRLIIRESARSPIIRRWLVLSLLHYRNFCLPSRSNRAFNQYRNLICQEISRFDCDVWPPSFSNTIPTNICVSLHLSKCRVIACSDISSQWICCLSR